MGNDEPGVMNTTLEARQINTIRALAMDAVMRARSGHTGTAMALAPLAHVLFTRILRYDAAAPDWPDRDRFILSAGHASMLVYAMAHLVGYGVTLDDIRDFRQLGSITPGHPEYGLTPGVEVTTGPLGQGLANAVGMAMAERGLRSRLGADLVDHRTFVIVSDGDLMEGISHEAASLAGHQQLGRLVAVYDDNHITIDGSTELALSDDAARRFEAYGWHVADLGEAAEDTDALERAIREATLVSDRPSMIIVRSHIGYPMPSAADTSAAHGAITDAEEIAAAKRAMGMDPEATFVVDDDVVQAYRSAGAHGATERIEWEARLAASGHDRGWLEALWSAGAVNGELSDLPTFEAGTQMATRVAANRVLDASLDTVPALISGGADLTGNTGTNVTAEVLSAANPSGRKLYFGVREHAMGAVANGMALHGGVLPVVGTFLVFSDYMRPAVRLAALSGAKTVFVWTHDSIGVGEDGPTHQPVEHVASLRAIPGLCVIRPADANETSQAWQIAVERDGPTALVLTRQNVPVLDGTDRPSQVASGAYVLIDTPAPAVILAGTGSEVQCCTAAAALLAADGIASSVVSMPSWDLFESQDAEYRAAVFPPGVPVLGVEAGSAMGWDRYADATVTMNRFGASAPGDHLMDHFGFTAPAIADAARALL
ncbi:transketolase [Candidatus Poriferisodalis sp.]|uniref:transketolase n=1 Tax=Candidatus Poriferisodalis sp. TaxID=3101277 RepID=UPI003B01475A